LFFILTAGINENKKRKNDLNKIYKIDLKDAHLVDHADEKSIETGFLTHGQSLLKFKPE
jgi:hypothetical protein